MLQLHMFPIIEKTYAHFRREAFWEMLMNSSDHEPVTSLKEVFFFEMPQSLGPLDQPLNILENLALKPNHHLTDKSALIMAIWSAHMKIASNYMDILSSGMSSKLIKIKNINKTLLAQL